MANSLKWVAFEMDALAPTNTLVENIKGTKYGMPFTTFVENEPRFKPMKSLDGTLFLCTEIETYLPSISGVFMISGETSTITSVDFVPIDGGLPPNP